MYVKRKHVYAKEITVSSACLWTPFLYTSYIFIIFSCQKMSIKKISISTDSPSVYERRLLTMLINFHILFLMNIYDCNMLVIMFVIVRNNAENANFFFFLRSLILSTKSTNLIKHKTKKNDFFYFWFI